MKEDLELTSSRYEMALGAFYVTYIVSLITVRLAYHILTAPGVRMDDATVEGVPGSQVCGHNGSKLGNDSIIA